MVIQPPDEHAFAAGSSVIARHSEQRAVSSFQSLFPQFLTDDGPSLESSLFGPLKIQSSGCRRRGILNIARYRTYSFYRLLFITYMRPRALLSLGHSHLWFNLLSQLFSCGLTKYVAHFCTMCTAARGVTDVRYFSCSRVKFNRRAVEIGGTRF